MCIDYFRLIKTISLYKIDTFSSAQNLLNALQRQTRCNMHDEISGRALCRFLFLSEDGTVKQMQNLFQT